MGGLGARVLHGRLPSWGELLPLIRRMALYRFDGDEVAVEAIRGEDRLRSPNDRLTRSLSTCTCSPGTGALKTARHLSSHDQVRHNTHADRIAARDHLIERQMPTSPHGLHVEVEAHAAAGEEGARG